MHGDDAHLAAKSIFKSETCIKTMAPPNIESLDYLCLSKGNFEIFLRELLLVRSYRVEVFTNKSRTNDWSIEFKGSPGNLIQFESMLFGGSEMVTGTAIIGLNMKLDGQQKVV